MRSRLDGGRVYSNNWEGGGMNRRSFLKSIAIAAIAATTGLPKLRQLQHCNVYNTKYTLIELVKAYNPSGELARIADCLTGENPILKDLV